MVGGAESAFLRGRQLVAAKAGVLTELQVRFSRGAGAFGAVSRIEDTGRTAKPLKSLSFLIHEKILAEQPLQGSPTAGLAGASGWM